MRLLKRLYRKGPSLLCQRVAGLALDDLQDWGESLSIEIYILKVNEARRGRGAIKEAPPSRAPGLGSDFTPG